MFSDDKLKVVHEKVAVPTFSSITVSKIYAKRTYRMMKFSSYFYLDKCIASGRMCLPSGKVVLRHKSITAASKFKL